MSSEINFEIISGLLVIVNSNVSGYNDHFFHF